MHILNVKNLSKKFGRVVALQDLSFDIPAGKIIGIIGPNGSGKTTLFNILTGLVKADSGIVMFKGKKILKAKPYEIYRMGIARTFQLTKPFSSLSVMQNVLVGLLFGRPALKMKTAMQEAFKILDEVKLSEKSDEIVENLTYFEKRVVELARALACKPALLLLDEPFAGMTSSEIEQFSHVVTLKNKMGVTVLLIEHTLHVLIDLADHIIVLNQGNKLAEGTPEKILDDAQVASIYLGKVK